MTDRPNHYAQTYCYTRKMKTNLDPRATSFFSIYPLNNALLSTLDTPSAPRIPAPEPPTRPIETKSKTSNGGREHRPTTTIFYVGPIPPIFSLHDLHTAVKGLNPREVMIDLRSGIMEVEIPFELNWQQISDWCQRGLKVGSLVLPIRMSVERSYDPRRHSERT